MFAHVSAVLRLEGLVLAVDAFHHAFLQDAVLVTGQQHVPVTPPDQFDDIPARPPEGAFEFLDDLAVTAYRTVETLQVAVDDEDQVVELFTRGHADGAERLDLVGFAVAEEGPDLAILGLDEAPAVHVFHEACLINRLDRPQTHRNGREAPVVRHQPGVRIRGEALAVNVLAEMEELLFRDVAHQEGAGVNTRNRVTLEKNHVATVVFVLTTPEPVETDVIQRSL